jgi:hypothetical protein
MSADFSTITTLGDTKPPSLLECPTRHTAISKLVRIARKNMITTQFCKTQAEFSLLYAKELAELEHDPQACVFCLSTRGVCFNFTQDASCECKGHRDCIDEMRTNGYLQKTQCQSCITRIAQMQMHARDEEEEEYVPPPPAKKRKVVYCGTPIGCGFCHKPRGHLGHCV